MNHRESITNHKGMVNYSIICVWINDRNLGENPFRASPHTIYQNDPSGLELNIFLKQASEKLKLDIH